MLGDVGPLIEFLFCIFYELQGSHVRSIEGKRLSMANVQFHFTRSFKHYLQAKLIKGNAPPLIAVSKLSICTPFKLRHIPCALHRKFLNYLQAKLIKGNALFKVLYVIAHNGQNFVEFLVFNKQPFMGMFP
jgi:hypothetical protein